MNENIKELFAIEQMQKQLDEAIELLKLAFEDISDLKDCHHCDNNVFEKCPGCGEYEDEISWKWQYWDRYERLQKEVVRLAIERAKDE